MVEVKPTFKEWCVLELMGHRRLAGLVTEQEIAGAAFLRLEIPSGRYDIEGGEFDGTTQFYSPSAVYCMTPTTEDIAREVAAKSQPEPVHRWELPQLPDRPSAIPDPDPLRDTVDDLDDLPF